MPLSRPSWLRMGPGISTPRELPNLRIAVFMSEVYHCHRRCNKVIPIKAKAGVDQGRKASGAPRSLGRHGTVYGGLWRSVDQGPRPGAIAIVFVGFIGGANLLVVLSGRFRIRSRSRTLWPQRLDAGLAVGMGISVTTAIPR
jgi:hypothetical protein